MKKTNIRSFVFLTALTLYIPAVLSIWTQPFPITIILFAAATWSSMYHYYHQQQFSSLDLIWANLVVLITMIMLVLMAMDFGVRSKEFIYPFLVALGAGIIYSWKGSIPQGKSSEQVKDYDIWHGTWHIFSTLAAIAIVYHKSDYRQTLKPLSALFSSSKK